MKLTDIIDLYGLGMSPALRVAFIKTLEALLPPLRHLPLPVRFRASGALAAWLAVFDVVPSTAEAHELLADPIMPPWVTHASFLLAMQPLITIPTHSFAIAEPWVQSMLKLSSGLLAFWLRPNVIYEPTLALGGLLGGVDMSQDLPMQLLRPTVSTLCIVPPWQQRHLCADASAIQIFSHTVTVEEHPAKRGLTWVVQKANAKDVSFLELLLLVKDENETLASVLARALAPEDGSTIDDVLGREVADARMQRWKLVLDYSIKILLYLSLEDAAIREHKPYTAAPKEFPGLGRRKREARMAEVNQQYDRCIVGPASAAQWAGEQATQLGENGQVSAHWRRGHFRLQPHGPQSSLRKVLFIMPTVVRADRLELSVPLDSRQIPVVDKEPPNTPRRT